MKCEFCSADCDVQTIDPSGKFPPTWCCSTCWYTGRLLERNLAGAIMVLDEAAKRAGVHARWRGVGTGGGCFALELCLGANEEDGPPRLWLTQSEDTLTGDHTIAELDESGWWLGAYRSDDEGWHQDPLTTEEVPMLVGEAIQWALNEGNNE